jgi:hypothetical protein
MASYSLIPTFSGFSYDVAKGEIGLDPIIVDDSDVLRGGYRGGEDFYRTVWSLDSGWGVFEILSGSTSVTVLHGSLEINLLTLPGADAGSSTTRTASLMDAAGREQRVAVETTDLEPGRSVIEFDSPLVIHEGEQLVIRSARISV